MSTLERYKTALELIGYREMCHDSEAEEMRQLARNAVGMNNPIPSHNATPVCFHRPNRGRT